MGKSKWAITVKPGIRKIGTEASKQRKRGAGSRKVRARTGCQPTGTTAPILPITRQVQNAKARTNGQTWNTGYP